MQEVFHSIRVQLQAVVLITLTTLLWRLRYAYIILIAAGVLFLLLCFFGFEPRGEAYKLVFGSSLAQYPVVHLTYFHLFFLFVFGGVIFYSCACMDHYNMKDRSILFWHNMPVADSMWIVGQMLGALVFFALASLSLLGYGLLFSVFEYFIFGDRGFGAIIALNLRDWLGMLGRGAWIFTLSLGLASVLAFCALALRPWVWWALMALLVVLERIETAAVTDNPVLEALAWYQHGVFASIWRVHLGHAPGGVDGDLAALLLTTLALAVVMVVLTARRRRGVYMSMH